MSVIRGIRLFFRSLFALFMLGGLVVITVNAFDEERSAQTQNLLATPANRFSAEQNIYLAFMGFDAPPGEAVLARGQAALDRFEKTLAAGQNKPGGSSEQFTQTRPDALLFKGKTDFLQPLKSSVWKDVDSHRDEIADLLADNQTLLMRYLALQSLSGYYELATPNIAMPSVFPPKEVRALFLADFVMRMKRRQLAEQKAALADLEGDIHVWRAVLIGEGSLISKMMAVANLNADNLVLADLIADNSLDLSELALDIERISTPFAETDWKIGNAFAYEYRLMAGLWQQLFSSANLFAEISDSTKSSPANQDAPTWSQHLWTRISFHFFQHHATENLSALSMTQIIQMADGNPENVIAARDAYAEWAQQHLAASLHYLYNPIGKTLLDIAGPDYATYVLRAYDAAALQRLLRLSFEIRKQGIAAREIPQFIQKHPEWARHPVNDQAFLWNEKTHEIALAPLSNQARDRRFSVPVWQGTN